MLMQATVSSQRDVPKSVTGSRDVLQKRDDAHFGSRPVPVSGVSRPGHG